MRVAVAVATAVEVVSTVVASEAADFAVAVLAASEAEL
jgi:hypothetical protein